jgi:hypothetical protein
MFNAHMSDIIIDMFVVNDADEKQVILTVFLLKLLLTKPSEHIQNSDWKWHLEGKQIVTFVYIHF